MTDNLSDNSNRRLFRAEVPPKLNAEYERLPHIEKQIEECLMLSEREFLARLAVIDREAEEFLREETLICLLTLAHAENLAQIESLMAQRLSLSYKKRIEKVFRNDSFDQNFIEEAIGDIQYLMLKQIFERTEKSYDFWETRFYKALNALISAYRRKHGEKYRATTLFGERSDDDGKKDFRKLSVEDEDYPGNKEKQLASRQILAKMPKDLQQIFILYYQEKETQEAIAEAFGITTRTVRNKLQRIREFLDTWRDSQGDLK